MEVLELLDGKVLVSELSDKAILLESGLDSLGFTVWIVLFSRSDLALKVFKGLTVRPAELKKWL